MTLGLLRCVRVALGDELAVFQHPDVLAHAHDHFHVVLDEQDGQVEFVADMPDETHELGAFLRVHPRRGFVEEQEIRAGRQRAGDFKAPLRPVGQARRFFIYVGIEREAVDEALRLFADFLFLAPGVGQAEDGHPPLAFAADLAADHAFSSAVSLPKSRIFWKVRAMPALQIRCGGKPFTLRPLKRMSPSCGL
mgnify:CR=1 FL=1